MMKFINENINEFNNEGPSTPLPDLSNFKFDFKPNKSVINNN